MFTNADPQRQAFRKYSTPRAFRALEVSRGSMPIETGSDYEESRPRASAQPVPDIATVRKLTNKRPTVDKSTPDNSPKAIAFDEGRLAGLRGRGLGSNPYDSFENWFLYEAWNEGFETS